MLSDEQLALDAQNGDEKSAEELLRRFKNMVVKCTRPYYIIGAEQDDLIQEGMLGLYRAALGYKQGSCKFITYAYQCVKTSIIDAVKSANANKNSWLINYVEGVNEDKGFSPEIIAEQMESGAELLERIKEVLSKREYIVFNLFINGNSISDIARAINCEYKSIDNSLQRIRLKVRKLLE